VQNINWSSREAAMANKGQLAKKVQGQIESLFGYPPTPCIYFQKRVGNYLDNRR
jgi:hypothetical protein